MTRRRQEGFTLIELLISLAILAIAFSVLFGAISNSLDRARKNRDDAVAMSLVQSLLTRASAAQNLHPGETEGIYSNGFHWRLTVRPYGDADDAKAWKVSAYAVRATVSWPGGEHALSALRLIPPPAKQP